MEAMKQHGLEFCMGKGINISSTRKGRTLIQRQARSSKSSGLSEPTQAQGPEPQIPIARVLMNLTRPDYGVGAGSYGSRSVGSLHEREEDDWKTSSSVIIQSAKL